MELTKAQVDFLKYCKEIKYGKIEVVIKDGEPVYSTQAKEGRKFGD